MNVKIIKPRHSCFEFSIHIYFEIFKLLSSTPWIFLELRNVSHKSLIKNLVIHTQWTWVWASFGRWWWTEKPGVLLSMGSQRVGCDWATELSWIHIGLSLTQKKLTIQTEKKGTYKVHTVSFTLTGLKTFFVWNRTSFLTTVRLRIVVKKSGKIKDSQLTSEIFTIF